MEKLVVTHEDNSILYVVGIRGMNDASPGLTRGRICLEAVAVLAI